MVTESATPQGNEVPPLLRYRPRGQTSETHRFTERQQVIFFVKRISLIADIPPRDVHVPVSAGPKGYDLDIAHVLSLILVSALS